MLICGKLPLVVTIRLSRLPPVQNNINIYFSKYSSGIIWLQEVIEHISQFG